MQREEKQKRLKDIQRRYKSGEITEAQLEKMVDAVVSAGNYESKSRTKAVSDFSGQRKGADLIANRLVGNLISSGLKLPGQLKTTAGTLLDAAGVDQLGGYLQRTGRQDLNNANMFINASRLKQAANTGENKFVGDLSSGTGSIITAMTLGRFSPTLAPAYYGFSSGADATAGALDYGASTSRALFSGASTALANALLERVFPEGIRMHGSFVPSTLRAIGREGLEEASQSLATSVLSDIYTDVDYADAFKQAGYEGLLGGILGGASNLSIDAYNNRTPLYGDINGFISGQNATGFDEAQQAGRVFEGVDGKPRFEVDDSGAKLNTKNLQKVNKLGDVLDHDKLYEQYPQLKDIPVEVTANQYSSFNGEKIELSAFAMKDASTLLHEVQHAIQEKEGFASGASTDTITGGRNDPNYFNNAAEAEARAVASRMNMSDGERYVSPTGKKLYHGTDAEFDEFQVGRPVKRRMMFSEYDTTSNGIFFTDSKAETKNFGRNVKEATVDIKKPLVFSDRANDALFNEFDNMIANDPNITDIKPGEPGFSEWMYFDGDMGKKFVEFAKSKGFDGALLDETGELTGETLNTYVAFDTKQIKPAKPQSTFYDSLDVPKEDLIIRDGSGKAMNIDNLLGANWEIKPSINGAALQSMLAKRNKNTRN